MAKVRRPRAVVLNCATNAVREGEHFRSQAADDFLAGLAAVDSDSWVADERTSEYIGLGWSEVRSRSDAILAAAYPDTDRGRAAQVRAESRAREALRAEPVKNHGILDSHFCRSSWAGTQCRLVSGHEGKHNYSREALRASEPTKVAERPAPVQRIAAEAVTARRSVWQDADPNRGPVRLGWIPR